MAKASDYQPFTISAVGEKTKTTYSGTFKVKVVLSYREEVLRDRLTREALGSHPESAPPRIRDLAAMDADFQVSIVDSPPWWKASNGGSELQGDDNIFALVFERMTALRQENAGGTEAEAADNKSKIEKVLADPDAK